MSQFTYTKTELQPGDEARFNVAIGDQVIGQVYKIRKDHRDLWQYDGTRFPAHLFHSRYEAARKLHERQTRPRPIFS